MALQAFRKTHVVTVRISVPEEVHHLVEEYARFLQGDTTASYIYGETARRTATSDRAFMASRKGGGA